MDRNLEIAFKLRSNMFLIVIIILKQIMEKYCASSTVVIEQNIVDSALYIKNIILIYLLKGRYCYNRNLDTFLIYCVIY